MTRRDEDAARRGVLHIVAAPDPRATLRAKLARAATLRRMAELKAQVGGLSRDEEPR